MSPEAIKLTVDLESGWFDQEEDFGARCEGEVSDSARRELDGDGVQTWSDRNQAKTLVCKGTYFDDSTRKAVASGNRPRNFAGEENVPGREGSKEATANRMR